MLIADQWDIEFYCLIWKHKNGTPQNPRKVHGVWSIQRDN